MESAQRAKFSVAPLIQEPDMSNSRGDATRLSCIITNAQRQLAQSAGESYNPEASVVSELNGYGNYKIH